ncbi:hypothetical protein FRC06_010336, partial [Ceratobasidium sp. 370]
MLFPQLPGIIGMDIGPKSNELKDIVTSRDRSQLIQESSLTIAPTLSERIMTTFKTSYIPRRLLIRVARSEFPDVTELLDSSPGLDARLLYNKRQSLAAYASGESSTGIDTQPDGNPKANTLDADDLRALQLLLEFINLEFTDTTAQVAELLDEGMITWNLLWVLCEKGTIMQRGSDDIELSAFELLKWVYKDKEINRVPSPGSIQVVHEGAGSKQAA